MLCECGSEWFTVTYEATVMRCVSGKTGQAAPDLPEGVRIEDAIPIRAICTLCERPVTLREDLVRLSAKD